MDCLSHLIHAIGWDGLTAIATVVVALGTVALAVIGGLAVSYAKKQLNDIRRESKIKHLIDLVELFEQNPLASQRRSLGIQRTSEGRLKPLDTDNPPYELHDIMNFFEHMGYLLDGGYLDLHGVHTEFHYWIFHVWADSKELVKVEQSEVPLFYEYFEKMVGQLAEVEKQRFGKFDLPSQQDVADFYVEEARLPAGSPVPRQKRKKLRK